MRKWLNRLAVPNVELVSSWYGYVTCGLTWPGHRCCGPSSSAPPSVMAHTEPQADNFPHGGVLLLVLELVSAHLVTSLVCKSWRELLAPELKQRPSELIRGLVDGMVAFLEAQEYAVLKAEEEDDEEDEEGSNVVAALVAARKAAVASEPCALRLQDQCAADFILSRIRQQPVPRVEMTTFDTLMHLSPSDPDDFISPSQEYELRRAWGAVLRRKVPATWLFHRLDQSPCAGDIDLVNPYGYFEGVQLGRVWGGTDWILKVGSFCLMSLENGAEYSYWLGDEDDEGVPEGMRMYPPWIDAEGEGVPEGTHDARRNDFRGCCEVAIHVRGKRLLEVSSDGRLEGLPAPPFILHWCYDSVYYAAYDTPEYHRRRRSDDVPVGEFCGARHRLERMWSPWGSLDAWKTWVYPFGESAEGAAAARDVRRLHHDPVDGDLADGRSHRSPTTLL